VKRHTREVSGYLGDPTAPVVEGPPGSLTAGWSESLGVRRPALLRAEAPREDEVVLVMPKGAAGALRSRLMLGSRVPAQQLPGIRRAAAEALSESVRGAARPWGDTEVPLVLKRRDAEQVVALATGAIPLTDPLRGNVLYGLERAYDAERRHREAIDTTVRQLEGSKGSGVEPVVIDVVGEVVDE
jgi:hypothetical protein